MESLLGSPWWQIAKLEDSVRKGLGCLGPFSSFGVMQVMVTSVVSQQDFPGDNIILAT